ncbi:MAG: histidine triad nucleotide-binding protein [Chloroflexota bacterium]|nr:histidine triad nucleotide-binding protein [Chloroflexota bacterium]
MSEREPDCLFCKIVAGEIPAEIIHRDDRVVAFRDINPQAPTHVLAIPTRHVASAAELSADDGDLLSDLFGALRSVAADQGLSGYRIVTNIGAEAGQSVFHLHFHLLGGRSMGWPPG